jgi:hypothetical protein
VVVSARVDEAVHQVQVGFNPRSGLVTAIGCYAALAPQRKTRKLTALSIEASAPTGDCPSYKMRFSGPSP